jgi:hypothetical protein
VTWSSYIHMASAEKKSSDVVTTAVTSASASAGDSKTQFDIGSFGVLNNDLKARSRVASFSRDSAPRACAEVKNMLSRFESNDLLTVMNNAGFPFRRDNWLYFGIYSADGEELAFVLNELNADTVTGKQEGMTL